VLVRVAFVTDIVFCIILRSHQFDLKGRGRSADLCVGGIIIIKCLSVRLRIELIWFR
jgi:hypothetical protein